MWLDNQLDDVRFWPKADSLARREPTLKLETFVRGGFTSGVSHRLLDALPRALGLLGDEVARHRVTQVKVGVGGTLDVVGCDVGDRLRPGLDVLDGAAFGDAPAVAAGEAFLVV